MTSTTDTEQGTGQQNAKNPGIAVSTVFPTAGGHDPAAPHVRSATVRVDAASTGTAITPIWASLGYDEINWTYTPTGKRLLRTIGDFSPTAFHVRPHYIFISGTGFGLPHQGSGNVYHEDETGTPFYDFTIADQTYDAIVEAGHHVLVELGFTPRDLVPDHAHTELTLTESPTVYSAYEAGQWGYPPKDYDKWAGLVTALAEHVLERYGEDEVSTWLWELWNEPDIFYWRGTPEEFDRLYEVTAAAVRRVLPTAKVGGPTVTGGPDGTGFMRQFLAYADERDLPIDFVSFHTKGSHFTPWRTYGPTGGEAPVKESPMTTKMLFEIRSLLRVMAEFPRYADVPAIVDECDAGVPAHWGVYDNSNFGFQNTEYYPVFQANLMKKILDLNETEVASVREATTWSFYFEGERYFEGTRALMTAGEVEKPFLNAYRLFAKLGGTRIAAASDAAWDVRELDTTAPASPPEEVDVLATRADDGEVAVLVYRHTDDQYQSDDVAASVTVDVSGLAASEYRLEHFRIDAEHSNAHTVWKELGSPQDPTEEQLSAIHARMGLERLEDERSLDVADGAARITIELPLESVSLLVLSPR
ncbi:glycoside hydrolase [Curtobacterium sp. MCBD17_035]|uniref:GH39 family glycosyl hydrolase n=1 Tax=Curtobacterium sp. MCBD17_035 TaxID=2175673 RepID=UPI000DA870F2|nr:glycoside hydrolase [Curtobacterium sp. MCBD17_035]WIB68445.1 glycoside hydrolase [Curtobacterium sp. MCBD17_035]